MSFKRVIQKRLTVGLLGQSEDKNSEFCSKSFMIEVFSEFFQPTVLPESFNCRTPDLPKFTPDFPPDQKNPQKACYDMTVFKMLKSSVINKVLAVQGTI